MGKNTELKIAKTFAWILAASFLVFGVCGAFTAETGFFIFEALSYSIFVALFYLFGIWLGTRRYKLLTIIALLGVFVMILIADYSEGGNTFTNFTWKNIVLIIAIFVGNIIASKHADELLEQEKNSEKENNKTENNINLDIEDKKDGKN